VISSVRSALREAAIGKSTQLEPAVTGWLSATDTLKELFNWFTEDDIKKLEQYGYELTIYEATEFKFHNNHWLIKQESSKPKGTIKLRNSKTLTSFRKYAIHFETYPRNF
jgi:hypothetical protein